MYPYANEEVAWQRLQDLQREMENSRRLALGHRPDWLNAAWWLGAKAVSAVRRLSSALAWRPAERTLRAEECETETDAA
ncbi:MAG: hypothetical protein ACHQ0J_00925 [Candidatus Dormibacterales bacterium]